LDSAVGAYRIYSEKECAEAPALDWPYVCALHLLRKPVESAISEFLAFVGNASRADRAWMIEYAPDLLRFRNTHEWCKGDTTAYISELQETPTTLIGWLHRYLTEGQAVAVHDVRGLRSATHCTPHSGRVPAAGKPEHSQHTGFSPGPTAGDHRLRYDRRSQTLVTRGNQSHVPVRAPDCAGEICDTR